MTQDDVNQKIENLISDNQVLLFMKGDKENPMCGFSAQVVQILNNYNANYKTINVLDDWDMREGIKAFSNWPTIPQLYIKGQFIGGCDIVMETHRKGELEPLLKA